MSVIYLDHQATTPLDPRVAAAMEPWWSRCIGNPSNLDHAAGRAARLAIESARGHVASTVQADPDEIVFTSGTTEANNWALFAAFEAAPRGAEFLISAVEHPSVTGVTERLHRNGLNIRRIPVDPVGRVLPKALVGHISQETCLVSVMSANNEVGTINPIPELAALCRARNVRFHCDAAQTAGKLPPQEFPADLISLSSHKLYGPPGVGALVIRRSEIFPRLDPLLFGGGQERKRRAGTLPTPLVVGFGEACRLAMAEQTRESARINTLAQRFQSSLTQTCAPVVFNGCPVDRLPGNVHVSFPGVDAQALLAEIGERVICSTGAACSAEDHRPSPVLAAMQLPLETRRGALRFGLGRFTTEAEVDETVTILQSALSGLRGD